MSYSFQVRKTDQGLEVVDTGHLAELAKHVPDGAVFTINGHTPSETSSAVGAVGITLSTGDDGRYRFVGAASGSYTTDPSRS